MKKINLITGGNGYIGSHTALEFLRRGHRVLIVDDLSNSFIETYESLKNSFGDLVLLLRCDVREYKKIIDSLNGYEVESIIHFAALKSVPESMEIPLDYIDININGLTSILKVADEKKPKSLIFSSSCAVYGKISENPVTEECNTGQQESIYAFTKKCGEDIIKNYSKVSKSGTKFYILRYFNPIGCDESLLIGENPRKDNFNVVGHLLKCNRESLEFSVFGNDYDTPDGTCIRDYIHVTDLANAHYMCSFGKGISDLNLYNVGTGVGNSVLSLIDSFNNVTGENPLMVNIKDRRNGDIESVWADSTKIENELGWSSRRSIEEALRSAYLFSISK